MKTFVVLAAALLAAVPSQAQQWSPSQPIRVIVPYAPVGTSDIIARSMSERVRERLGQPLVIENRPGASTQIGTEAVAKSRPDGHTLLIVANTFNVNPSLFAKLPYDSLKDLEPVTYAGVTPHVLVVHPSIPAKDLKELLDYVRARPGRLSYGSVGNGTSFHLGMEQLKKLSGTFIVHIPYKGMGPVLTDLLSNTVQLAFANPPNAAGFIASGRLRAVALAHASRLPQLPDVPTIAEQGFPGFESNSGFIYLAAGGTPAAILDRLNAEFVAILKEFAVREVLTKQGVEIMATSRAETAAFIRREMAKYAEVVKFSGARID
ncbi:MAG: tripartite tricarboxylate transporter substrate binding protein [Betaproteobacteria bacterium]|nr:tripartite tricarboxylate transporter substrate binding protein [Betaproteobacteria bacterium]